MPKPLYKLFQGVYGMAFHLVLNHLHYSIYFSWTGLTGPSFLQADQLPRWTKHGKVRPQSHDRGLYGTTVLDKLGWTRTHVTWLDVCMALSVLVTSQTRDLGQAFEASLGHVNTFGFRRLEDKGCTGYAYKIPLGIWYLSLHSRSPINATNFLSTPGIKRFVRA